MDESSLVYRILESRGIKTQEEIDKFLNPSIDTDWTDPYSIDGMEKVVDTVESAIKDGKKILIYGDYDLDGISATAVMVRGLTELNKHVDAGMTVDYFLPKRFDEGYGFSDNSVNRLLALENLPDLIITVDCGVTADKYIKILNGKGIDVVVTDHHEKSDGFPKDTPLIDPKVNDDEENSILAGVSVALKLIQALGAKMGMPNLWHEFVDLATLGTLADVMPVVGQNRALVKAGLEQINTKPSAALRAILSIANKKFGSLTSTDLLFSVTPRLNSTGRMDRPEVGVELLLSTEYNKAYTSGLVMEDLNVLRKDITMDILDEAKEIAKEIVENNPNIRSLVVASENWHKGVLGIVAAKLVETYHLPSIVLSIDGDVVTGSGRSYGAIDLHKACIQCFDKYEKFGGHAGACGMCFHVDDLAEFKMSLDKSMQKLEDVDFRERFYWDLEVDLHELNVEEVNGLNILEPYGKGNPEPMFLTKNCFIRRAKAVGFSHNHLSCFITDGVYGAQGIMFNVPDIESYLKCNSTICALYSARVEEFQSRINVKLFINDLFSSNELADFQEGDADESAYIDKLLEDSDESTSQKSSIGDFIQENVNRYNNDLILSFSQKNDYELSNYESELRGKSKHHIQTTIIKTLIGDAGVLHESQEKAIQALNDGKNVLSIMPTARGKSLIFQTFAASTAFADNKLSIFVYPLRALISDQLFHLQEKFKIFGFNIIALTGETSNEKRKEIYAHLKDGKIDILLTTPEYLSIHINEIAEVSNVGFLAIDEAHYLGKVKIGERTAYGHLPEITDKLNNPQVIASSATVNEETSKEIIRYLNITEVVTDNFERSNLYIDDRRNVKSRDDYLVSLCASGEKTVIYVNSRQQTVDLARIIKSKAPHVAMKVGFYNGGMTRDDRNKIEKLFRDNVFSVLVATSAFGEGVNIPDIRHVVLYHLPFSNVAFNQMAGRCGRDNKPAIVHLLYNRADATINTQILQLSNPDRGILGKIYIWLKASAKSREGKTRICINEIQNLFRANVLPAPTGSFLCALDVFEELGLIEVKHVKKDDEVFCDVTVFDSSSKVNLEDSSRFCEGQNELRKFEEYRLAAMRSSVDDLTRLLRHPILPDDIS